MTVTVDVLSDSEAAEFDGYVSRHVDGTPFHDTRWAALLRDAYGCRRHYLVARRAGAACGALPLIECGGWPFGRVLVALPFAGTQPSVLADDEEIATALVAAATRQTRAARVAWLELRETSERSWPLTCSSTYVNVRLPLERDPERVWQSRVDARVRTKVRAASKRGLSAVWSGREAVGDFFAVYADTMHRLGSPPHARRLFDALFTHYPDATRVLTIRDGDDVVAAAIVMHDAHWIGFPWAASLTSAMHKHPNNLLYWTLIEEACRSGYGHLDLGRSPIDSGTAHFKLQWGGVATPLHYYFATPAGTAPPTRDASDPRMQFASRLWRYLPIPLANHLGPHLAKCIP